ncbi:MAG: hypothetical protein AAF242_00005 [Bacteroidota bacterium]
MKNTILIFALLLVATFSVAQKNTRIIVRPDSITLKTFIPDPLRGDAIAAVVNNPVSFWLWDGSQWGQVNSNVDVETYWEEIDSSLIYRSPYTTLKPVATIEKSYIGVAPSRVTSLLILNRGEIAGGSDYQNESIITLRAGTTDCHRRYITFQDHDSTEIYATGVNATNNYVLYDSRSNSHRMWLNDVNNNGSSYINSTGTGAVVINGFNNGADNVGTGGFKVGDGVAGNIREFFIARSGNFSMGYQTAINNRYILNLGGLLTNNTGSSQGGLLFSTAYEPSAVSTSSFVGLNISNQTKGAFDFSGTISGLNVTPTHVGDGSIVNQIGAFIAPSVSGAGDVANQTSLRLQNNGDVASTSSMVILPSLATTANVHHGIRINNTNLSSNGFNAALRIDQSSGVNKYGLYVSGDATNYLDGNLGVGKIPNSLYKLDVEGNANLSGSNRSLLLNNKTGLKEANTVLEIGEGFSTSRIRSNVLEADGNAVISGTTRTTGNLTVESRASTSFTDSEIILNSSAAGRGMGVFGYGETDDWYWGVPYTSSKSWVINTSANAGTTGLSNPVSSVFRLNKETARLLISNRNTGLDRSAALEVANGNTSTGVVGNADASFNYLEALNGRGWKITGTNDLYINNNRVYHEGFQPPSSSTFFTGDQIATTSLNHTFNNNPLSFSDLNFFDMSSTLGLTYENSLSWDQDDFTIERNNTLTSDRFTLRSVYGWEMGVFNSSNIGVGMKMASANTFTIGRYSNNYVALEAGLTFKSSAGGSVVDLTLTNNGSRVDGSVALVDETSIASTDHLRYTEYGIPKNQPDVGDMIIAESDAKLKFAKGHDIFEVDVVGTTTLDRTDHLVLVTLNATVQLPSNPQDGDWVTIKFGDAGGIIDLNGGFVDGVATNITANPYDVFRLKHKGEWYLF